MTNKKSPSVGQLFGLVANYIQVVTRFDASDLSECQLEEVYSLPVALKVDQVVSYASQVTEGKGKLPRGVERVSNQEVFRKDLINRLNLAKTESPQALQGWANKDTGRYRRLMVGPEAFLREPGRVGYERTCGNCQGACRVICSSCSGRGRKRCHHCSGSGWTGCSNCAGSTKVNCNSCGGRGSFTEQVSHQVWDSRSSSYVRSYQTVARPCSGCGGSGRTRCYVCSGGQVRCHLCHGCGDVGCGHCGSSGRVDCAVCSASGIQHTFGTIVAEIKHSESLTVETTDQALRSLVEIKLPREDLPSLGQVIGVDHTFPNQAISTRYRFRVEVRFAKLSIRDRVFTIYGFGPKVRIFDLDNIAEYLLSADLEALEVSLSRASSWRRRRSSELLDVLADFLRSELNILINEYAANVNAKPEHVAAEVEKKFASSVSRTYVDRAIKALHAALGNLYAAELAEPAVYLCGLSALVAGALYGTGLWTTGIWQPVFWTVAAATAVWFFLEWITRRRIAQRFDADIRLRVMKRLTANKTIIRWRVASVVAVPLAATLSVQVTGMLPTVRAHHALQHERADAQLQVEQWSKQAEPDLSLRVYPDTRMLDEMSKAGNTQAQIILAWQKLLGAGDTPKDLEGAAQLLEMAAPHAENSSLWLTAKAVLLLNQEAMPDDIRAAAQDLAIAADSGLVEARYWQARIFLADQSPLRNPRLGQHLLVLSAEMGHANAALMLGQRLANGKNTRRNIGAAQRYLKYAANKGLEEARVALEKL